MFGFSNVSAMEPCDTKETSWLKREVFDKPSVSFEPAPFFADGTLLLTDTCPVFGGDVPFLAEGGRLESCEISGASDGLNSFGSSTPSHQVCVISNFLSVEILFEFYTKCFRCSVTVPEHT
jgi:hypothetical protein